METQTSTNTADMSQEYWAAMDLRNEAQQPDGTTKLVPASPDGDEDGANMAAELMRRQETYYTFYGSTGLFERDRRSYMSRYGLSPDGENVSYRVVRGGDNGQLALFVPNHYANILTHMATLVAAKKPSLQGRAENSDSDSLQQAKLADAVIDHFQRELDLEGASRDMLEMCLLQREAWYWLRWNSSKGEDFASEAPPEADPNGPAPIVKTGGLEWSVHQPGDVIRDVTALTIAEPTWLMVRHFVNRWDLVARFPEYRDEILAITRNQSDPYRVEFQTSSTQSDLIPVYQFYHKPTEALPEGRQCTLVSAERLLLDGPLSYGGEIPVVPMMPGRLHGTPFGYTPMFELLALQQILNALYSGLVTDAVAFAVRRILMPRGQPLTSTQLQTNLGVLYYDPSLPEPKLMETPLQTTEKLEAIQAIEKLFQVLSGINDVVRGTAENSGVKAASGLALLQAQALQYLSFLEFEYGRFWQRWGNLCLAILRERATTPLMIAVAGKNKQSALQSFTGDQIPTNYRVSVDLGNPLLKTAVGRQTIADQLMQMGGFGPPGLDATQKYMQFLTTGSIEPVLDAMTAEQDLITAENEALQRGEVPPVTEFDTPQAHYQGHAVVAFGKEARSGQVDPASMEPSNPVMQALLQHLMAHRAMEQKMAGVQNAQAAALASQQAMQAPGGPMGPPPPGMPPNGPGGPPGGPHPPRQPMDPNNPGVRQAQPAKPPPGSVPVPT